MALPQMRVRWIDRVVGVTIGAGATAWILRADPPASQGEDDHGVEKGAVVEPAIVARTHEEGGVAGDAPAATSAAVGPPTAAAAVPAVADPGAAALADSVPDDGDPLDARASAGTRAPDDAAAAGDAPILPLPRMPGDTRLSSSSRFDAEGPAWILKAAYRVHVREHHVVGFYRKALADQGLTVTQSEDPPGPDGSVKTYLHGKSARVHAQVGIMPRQGELETRVWILWRQRA